MSGIIASCFLFFYFFPQVPDMSRKEKPSTSILLVPDSLGAVLVPRLLETSTRAVILLSWGPLGMLPAGRQGLLFFWLVGLGFCCSRNRSFLQGIHMHAGQRDRPCFLRPCLSQGKKKLLDVPQDLTLFSHLDHATCAIAAFGCCQAYCRSRDLSAEDAERNRRVQLTELTAPHWAPGMFPSQCSNLCLLP